MGQFIADWSGLTPHTKFGAHIARCPQGLPGRPEVHPPKFAERIDFLRLQG